MTNRKKRLKKGIASIEEQIILHEEKKRIAQEEGKIERVKYYEKEISSLEEERDRKEDMLD